MNFLLTFAGFCCVALGGLGLFVPLMPTTPFLLLAGFCFSRSSPSHHAWLAAQPWYREYVAGYANGEGIPLRAKVTTLVLLWGAISVSAVWLISLWWARVLLVAIAGAVTLFLLAHKTRRSERKG